MKSRRTPARRLFPERGAKVVSPMLFFSALFISVFRLQRSLIFQLNENFSADVWLRTDCELPAHSVNSFLHAGQTEALVLLLRIEPATVVRQPELNFVSTNTQRRPEVPGIGMFDSVGEGLLRNAQQVLLTVRRYGSSITIRLEVR